MKKVLSLAAAGIAALSIMTAAAPSFADPATGVYPALAGVGSDTTQDVLDGLAAQYPNIGSYDARGSATIKTRATGCVINRPNGSSAGITALNASLTAGDGCVSFARSSRGPNNTSTTDLTFIPFGLDGVTFAAAQGLAGQLDAQNVSLADLQAVYRCQATAIDGVPVVPYLPQAGSGTRDFWAATMGISSATPGACVRTTIAGAEVQEHDGRPLNNATVSATAIIPFSIAQYIAQGNSIPGVDDRRGTPQVQLGTINEVAPRTGTGTLNTTFPVTRPIYNVVPSAQLGNPVVASTFVGASSSLCNATGDGIVANYGFGVVSNCGATTLRGES